MKFLKCMVIILTLVLAMGIGIYLCTDSKETEQVEEAVMI